MALKEDKNYYKTTEFVSEKIRSDRGWDEPEYDFSNRQTIPPLEMTEKEYQKQFLELMTIAMKTKDTSVIDELFELKRRGEFGNLFHSPEGIEETEELLWGIGTGKLSWEEVETEKNGRTY